MREIKDAEERRAEILAVAEELFNRKGYDATSTNDILKQLGIARGTLYYHFESKEAIMDGIIDRYNKKVIERVQQVVEQKALPVIDRLLLALLSLNISENASEEVMTHIHRPQNALMHQKIQQVLITEIIPLFTPIIQDGIAEGTFQTVYPYESIEMLIVYAVTIFDDEASLTLAEKNTRIQAFAFNAERVLGTKPDEISQKLLQISTKESRGKYVHSNHTQ